MKRSVTDVNVLALPQSGLRSLALSLLMTLTVLLAVACGSSDDGASDLTDPDTTADTTEETSPETIEETTPDTEVGTAKARVLHLSPDAPAVDILANDGAEPVFGDLEYKEGTPFADVPAASYDFHIAPKGGTKDDAVLSVSGLALAEDKAYTVVAYDALASLKALALEDDLSPVMTGKIRVRAIHTAKDVGEVDIWNIPAMGDPSPLYENVPFGAAGDYKELPVGAYTLGFDLDNDASPDVIFAIPELPSGTIANVFAVSDTSGVFLFAQLADGTTVRLDPTPAQVGTAKARVLHLSPDAPAVDILANDGATPVFADLEYKEGTPFADVPAASYDFHIAPKGGTKDDAVLSVSGLALAEDKAYTVVAYDALASLKALALEDDLSPVMTGKIRVRAIHTAKDVGEVDIWNIPAMGDPSPLYENVPFGAAGDYKELPVGAYTLGFDLDNDASPDVIFAIPELPSGTIANVFAVSDTSGVFLFAQLADGTTVRLDPAD